ncbi:MAG: multiheme c-type cytochrome [Fidelibacterota bacterium]
MKRLVSSPGSTVLVVSFLYLLAAPALGSTEIFILHTNNTNGALENCLCPGKSYGSLEKRALFVREWLKEHPNTVLVDAGDFLSATRNTLKDSIAFRAHELIDYDAMGLGDQEFFRGVSFISGLIESSQLPFVSTNLDTPVIANVSREIVVSREGVRFGILSLMNPDIFRLYPRRVADSVRVKNPLDALEERLAGMKGRSDVVILLSHLGIDRDREIARTFARIDVIVGAHTQTVMKEPEKVGNTVIVQAGGDGYYVGRLKLTLDEEKRIEEYQGDLVAMDIDLPNDPKVVAMIVEYNRLSRIRAGGVVERIPPIPDGFAVTSVEACAGCHSSQYEHWMSTGHAGAFETLVSDHKEKTPECLACHTTGYGRDDGYLNYNITRGLKNVTCTECHYVAAGHLSEPSVSPAAAITQASCVRCHDSENSPGFEFEPFLARIAHPVVITELTEEPGGSEPVPLIHTVRTGDTLWSLAERYLGQGSRWTEIHRANRETIHNPNMLLVGQEVMIPAVGPSGR